MEERGLAQQWKERHHDLGKVDLGSQNSEGLKIVIEEHGRPAERQSVLTDRAF